MSSKTLLLSSIISIGVALVPNYIVEAQLSASISLDSDAIEKRTHKTDDEILIAVVDTGADLDHSSFKHLLWSNPGETGLDSQGRDKSSNGFDDDTNGFIDDVHGWNFIDNSSDLNDNHGHGTHIAGLIAANRAKGAKIKFMILKYFDSTQPDSKVLESSNQSIEYALKMGARIINYSGGGDLPNIKERNLYRQTFERGIMVVAAAGNESRSNDFQGFYPASYGFENIISVASIDEDGKILNSSNFGSHTVDLGALGKDVVSSLPGNRFGKLTGTSQATAIVTGVVASLIFKVPTLQTPKQVKERLIATSSMSELLIGKVRSPRIPDIERATTMKDRNELKNGMQLAESRVRQVFDDPLSDRFKTVDRELSSFQLEERNKLNPPE